MLLSLSVKNFRSLHDARFAFSPSGLTILVGANGSGKSNLIKLLHFVGSLANTGLETTIRAAGGFEAISPKALVPRESRNAVTDIRYSVALGPRAEDATKATVVNHSFQLTNSPTPLQVLQHEQVEFTMVPVGTTAPVQEELVPRRVAFRHGTGLDHVVVDTNPVVTETNFDQYLRWFGLGLLEGLMKERTEAVFRDLIGKFISSRVPITPATPFRYRRETLVASRSAMTLGDDPKRFVEYLTRIKRYDLQLSELRRQQEFAQDRSLSTDGKGMPSVVHRLLSADDPAWDRIATVLRDIAPYVRTARVSQLTSGQEFVQFLEKHGGRAVESWQASDGTLRTLAILVAIETAPEGGVILIEEPEIGLHPWAIRTLMEYFREAIQRRHIQLVMTTHSQQVLDQAEPEEIVLATRTLSGGTQFMAAHEAVSGVLARGDIGQLWVEGLLGAVPTPLEDAD